MKYYETSFEEYLNAIKKYDSNSKFSEIVSKMPDNKWNLGNIILYGPCGVGKYSQALKLLHKYSPSKLKYEKKITTTTEKQNYNYHISDIHFEVDMSLLGCHSKVLWHEIFYQIVDIISIKNEKIGFILCKNFHYIHNELLEIFYSYIQQYSNINSFIKIYFIIITENISFLPNNILNSFQIINISRPSLNEYEKIILKQQTNNNNNIIEFNNNVINNFKKQINNVTKIKKNNSFDELFNSIHNSDITNIKELKCFHNIKDKEIPNEIFNIICDKTIYEMKNINLNLLRDTIYDILIYNLDATECIWYILKYFIVNNYIVNKDITDILFKLNLSLLYYNNNYRPIYHLENILLYIASKINVKK